MKFLVNSDAPQPWCLIDDGDYGWGVEMCRRQWIISPPTIDKTNLLDFYSAGANRAALSDKDTQLSPGLRR